MLKAFLWFAINVEAGNVFCNDSTSNKGLPGELKLPQHVKEPSFIVLYLLEVLSVHYLNFHSFLNYKS